MCNAGKKIRDRSVFDPDASSALPGINEIAQNISLLVLMPLERPVRAIRFFSLVTALTNVVLGPVSDKYRICTSDFFPSAGRHAAQALNPSLSFARSIPHIILPVSASTPQMKPFCA